MPGAPRPATLRAAAVLFDMDGTLVDSTALVERAWGGFADRFGLDLATVLAFAHGRPTAATVGQFLTDANEVADATADLTMLEVAMSDGVVEVPGAARLLSALPASCWAVVTSAGRELARARMAAAGLPPPPVLISANDVRAGKPDPEGFRSAAARLGVEIGQTVVFEDSEAGVRAALASGGRTVVVGTGPVPVPAPDGAAPGPGVPGPTAPGSPGPPASPGGGPFRALARVPDLRSVTVDPASRAGHVVLRLHDAPH